MAVIPDPIQEGLAFEPRGLMHRWNIVKRSYRLWPFPY